MTIKDLFDLPIVRVGRIEERGEFVCIFIFIGKEAFLQSGLFHLDTPFLLVRDLSWVLSNHEFMLIFDIEQVCEAVEVRPQPHLCFRFDALGSRLQDVIEPVLLGEELGWHEGVTPLCQVDTMRPFLHDEMIEFHCL